MLSRATSRIAFRATRSALSAAAALNGSTRRTATATSKQLFALSGTATTAAAVALPRVTAAPARFVNLPPKCPEKCSGAKGKTSATASAETSKTSATAAAVTTSDAAAAAKPAPKPSAAAKTPPTQPLRGLRDVMPPQSRLFSHIERTLTRAIAQYGFTSEVRSPVLEHADVFTATLGADSEVVQKQTYCFDDHGTLTVLRPEGTAGVMRSLVKRGAKAHELAQITAQMSNNNAKDGSKDGAVLSGKSAKASAASKDKDDGGGSGNGALEGYPDRFYYCGPMFRRERPQAGRLRQFTQFGLESVGPSDPTEDAVAIAAARAGLDALGLGPDAVELRLNSLGDAQDRDNYQKVRYLRHMQP